MYPKLVSGLVGVGPGGVTEGVGKNAVELLMVPDYLIGRHDQRHCQRVALEDCVIGECQTRRSVAVVWFKQEVLVL